MAHNLKGTKEEKLNTILNECLDNCTNSIQQALFNQLSNYMIKTQKEMMDSIQQLLINAGAAENIVKVLENNRVLLLNKFKHGNDKYLQQRKEESEALHKELKKEFRKFKAHDLLQSNNVKEQMDIVVPVEDQNVL